MIARLLGSIPTLPPRRSASTNDTTGGGLPGDLAAALASFHARSYRNRSPPLLDPWPRLPGRRGLHPCVPRHRAHFDGPPFPALKHDYPNTRNTPHSSDALV
jgi:hypothetical protein